MPLGENLLYGIYCGDYWNARVYYPAPARNKNLWVKFSRTLFIVIT